MFDPRLLLVVVCLTCLLQVFSAADQQKCAKELTDWCKGNNYSSNDSESTFLYSIFANGKYTRIYCTTDNNGTECLKNKQPWFECFPNGTLIYEEQDLTLNPNLDDDICFARNISQYIGQISGFNQTAFNVEMQHFQNAMFNFQSNLQAQMENMKQELSGMFDGFSNGSDISDYK